MFGLKTHRLCNRLVNNRNSSSDAEGVSRELANVSDVEAEVGP